MASMTLRFAPCGVPAIGSITGQSTSRADASPRPPTGLCKPPDKSTRAGSSRSPSGATSTSPMSRAGSKDGSARARRRRLCNAPDTGAPRCRDTERDGSSPGHFIRLLLAMRLCGYPDVRRFCLCLSQWRLMGEQAKRARRVYVIPDNRRHLFDVKLGSIGTNRLP
jgi:hypothetical protein